MSPCSTKSDIRRSLRDDVKILTPDPRAVLKFESLPSESMLKFERAPQEKGSSTLEQLDPPPDAMGADWLKS